MLNATQHWARRTAACHCCLTARITRYRVAAATTPNNSLVPRNTTGCQGYARTLMDCRVLCDPGGAAPQTPFQASVSMRRLVEAPRKIET